MSTRFFTNYSDATVEFDHVSDHKFREAQYPPDSLGLVRAIRGQA